MSKIGIIGWALSEFGTRREEVNRNELIYDTTTAVLDNAGLKMKDIDKVISASCDTIDGISISNAFAVDDMGAYMKEESKVEEDGAYAMMYAYYRMLTGQWKNCMIIAHGKNSDASPAFYSNMSCDPFLLRPMGMETNSAAALQAQVYYNNSGVTEEDVASVAVKNRKAGSKNPRTLLRSEVSREEVLNSPYIATPIKDLEAPPITDGAAAIILAREDFANQSKNKPVWVEGMGFSQDIYYPGFRDLEVLKSCRTAAQMAYKDAGIKDPLKETDFAEVSEGFAFYELMLCEALGLCAEGKASGLIKDGNYPVNPSGGALCANPIMVTGLIRVIESYLQLTGEAGENQVDIKKGKAIAHAFSGMFMQSNLVSILSV